MAVATAWRRLHTRSRWVRWPLKALTFAIVLLFVLYPRIDLLPTFLTRLANLERVLEPDHPYIVALAAEIRAELPADAGVAQVTAVVEREVVRRVPYAFDWETWGVMCYVPTVAEVVALGREDCDGRAVVAASVLRHLGYEAWLVADLKHMWVRARKPGADGPARELMGAGAGEVTLASPAPTEDRTVWHLTWGALQNLGRGLTFGIAVFPLGRELVLLVVLLLLTWRPGVGAPSVLFSAALGIGGLLALRQVGALAELTPLILAAQWAGAAAVLAGWLWLAWAPARAPGTLEARITIESQPAPARQESVSHTPP